MARTMPGAVEGGVALEVERFGWSDGRLEVAGRWYGVRGRRFVRPTLELGDGRRLLAVLDHKPWAAEDGREWFAAFTWSGPQRNLDDPVLAVASGIEVTLPNLSSKNRMTGETRREVTETRFERPRAEATQLAAATAEQVALPPPAPPVITAPPPAEIDEAPVVAAEPDPALAEEVEALRAELAAAKEHLAVLRRERDDARADRTMLIGDRDATRGALAERAQLEQQRDEAIAARVALMAERDEALQERDAHERQRDRAEQTRAQMEKERDHAFAERDALRRERAAIAPTPAARRALFRREPDEPPAVLWATRVIALTALVAGLTLLAIFFRALVGA